MLEAFPSFSKRIGSCCPGTKYYPELGILGLP
jgi:hypothetical protein